VVVFAPEVALAAPCRVEIEAPAEVLAAMGEAATGEHLRCAGTRIVVRAVEGGYEVERVGEESPVVRRVADARTAAALAKASALELAARGGAEAAPAPGSGAPASQPDATPPEAAAPTPAPALSASPTPPATPATPAPAVPAAPAEGWTFGGDATLALSARIGFALASDASLWGDATLGGCVHVGPVCVGVAVRGVFDTVASGPARELQTARGGLDGVATVELPLRSDRLAFTPALGLGAGWIRASFFDEALGSVSDDRALLRIELHARLGVHLAGPVWMELGALANLAPLADPHPASKGGVLLAGTPLFRAGIDGGVRVEL
jgi:hypothetical protein